MVNFSQTFFIYIGQLGLLRHTSSAKIVCLIQIFDRNRFAILKFDKILFLSLSYTHTLSISLSKFDTDSVTLPSINSIETEII